MLGPMRALKSQTAEERTTMRTITLEEYFASPEFLDGPGEKSKNRPEIRRPRRQDRRAALRCRRQEDGGDGCRRYRHASAVADVAGHRANGSSRRDRRLRAKRTITSPMR